MQKRLSCRQSFYIVKYVNVEVFTAMSANAVIISFVLSC